jgi:hypothetical protein
VGGGLPPPPGVVVTTASAEQENQHDDQDDELNAHALTCPMYLLRIGELQGNADHPFKVAYVVQGSFKVLGSEL